MNKKNVLTLLLLSGMGINAVNGQEITLDEISVEAKTDKIAGSAVENSINLSDQIVAREKLSLSSATLGNALSREIGVHSNPFGGGASSPIIRGQEGVRVKILQNGSDVIDMSTISPDHAVAADTLLAQRVELIRGPQTLLYATASQAGIINVADKRILAEMPKKALKVKFIRAWIVSARKNLSRRDSVLH